MNYLPVVFLATLCVACNPPANKEAGSILIETKRPLEQQDAVPAKDNPAAPDRATNLGRDTLAIIDDEFVKQVFDKFLPYKTIIKSRRGFKLSQQTEPGDSPQVVDTINTFSDQLNSFTYLQSGDPAASSALLIKARIGSPTVKLPKNIRVGMSKAAFAVAFHRQAVPAVVVVAETEGYQRFTFTFAHGVLISVSFVSNYMG